MLRAAVRQKLDRYFKTPAHAKRLHVFTSTTDRDHLLELLSFYVTQHCARKNVRVARRRYSIFCQYRKMVNQYSKAYFSADRPPGSKTSVLTRNTTISLPQMHFLFWLISNDIDLDFLPQQTSLEESMKSHRKAVTKAYRERQRFRKSAVPCKGAYCALMPTAARQSRHSPVDVVACDVACPPISHCP
jgi:hypothetical protein